MKAFKEFWRTVVIDGAEHTRYIVSNFGKVKCLNWNKTGKEKLCKISKNGSGYSTIRIDKIYTSIHRIVAETFIPNPEHKTEVDHVSTVKTDNVVILDNDGKTILYTNLRWTTPKENRNNTITKKNMSRNAGKSMIGKFGAEHPNAIPIVQLALDGQFIKKWSCATEAGRELGINRPNIIECCNSKRKSAGGYRWMYYDDWLKVCKCKPEDIKPLF